MKRDSSEYGNTRLQCGHLVQFDDPAARIGEHCYCVRCEQGAQVVGSNACPYFVRCDDCTPNMIWTGRSLRKGRVRLSHHSDHQARLIASTATHAAMMGLLVKHLGREDERVQIMSKKNTTAFDFTAVTVGVSDEPVRQSRTGRRAGYLDTPFPDAVRASYKSGETLEVTVPAEVVGQVRQYIRDSAAAQELSAITSVADATDDGSHQSVRFRAVERRTRKPRNTDAAE